MPQFEPKGVREYGWGVTAPNYATATHAVTVLTYYGIDDGVSCRGLYGVAWSYTGGTPAGGNLLVQDGAITVLNLDLPATAISDRIVFPTPYVAAQGNNLTVTLADGGSGIVGKVNGIGQFTTASYPADAPLGIDFDFGDPDLSGLLFAGVL